MTNTERSTVVGIFEDRSKADQAVSALRSAGFRDNQIGVVMRRPDTTCSTTAEPGTTHEAEHEEGTHWETGAIAGVLAGLGLGGLVGLGVVSGMIPVLGPALAAGTWGTILTNAAGGAIAAGIAGGLIGAGIPEEEARFYESEVKAGRTMVTVKADGRAGEAETILRRYGAYDLRTADATRLAASAPWKSTGAACATGATTEPAGHTMRLHEEELRACKEPVEAGEVRVRKEVHTEHKSVEVPVEREEVIVERRPASGQPASGEAIREGEEIRIPVKEEQVRVEKTPVVKEEVAVQKRVVHDTERVAGDVRKEEVKVENKGDVDVHTRDKRRT